MEFELHSPVQNIRGVSAAGVPVLGIGHNGSLAWGFTSGLSDEDDLYAERLTGAETYTFKGQQRQMSCRDERFDYRSPATDLPDRIGDIIKPGSLAGSKTERICRTVHGPVQSRAGGVAFARRYAIWGRELETLVGLTALNDAKTVREADRAMLQVTWNENVIAADDQRQHRVLAPRAAPAAPARLRRAAALPGHRRGRVARAAAAAQDAPRDQPAPGVPGAVEQRAVDGMDVGRRRGPRTPDRAVPPFRPDPAAGGAPGRQALV